MEILFGKDPSEFQMERLHVWNDSESEPVPTLLFDAAVFFSFPIYLT